MIWGLALLFVATGAFLWVRAAPLFDAIQRRVRAGGMVITGDLDEELANRWAAGATPAQGTRRLRFVAVVLVITGATIGWIGASA